MKLLIAVRSEAIAQGLGKSLPQYEIHTCYDGEDAASLLDTLRPEFLVISLSLPVVDGLTVLAQSRHKPAVTVGLTNLVSREVLEAAANADVQAVLPVPCTVRHIVEHLQALTEKALSSKG